MMSSVGTKVSAPEARPLCRAHDSVVILARAKRSARMPSDTSAGANAYWIALSAACFELESSWLPSRTAPFRAWRNGGLNLTYVQWGCHETWMAVNKLRRECITESVVTPVVHGMAAQARLR